MADLEEVLADDEFYDKVLKKEMKRAEVSKFERLRETGIKLKIVPKTRNISSDNIFLFICSEGEARTGTMGESSRTKTCRMVGFCYIIPAKIYPFFLFFLFKDEASVGPRDHLAGDPPLQVCRADA